MIITVYDYANKPVEVEIPAQTYEDIQCIVVRILSGDETGTIFMKNGDFISFDSSDMRIRGYDDGSYTVMGTKMIKKWIEYEPKKDGFTISYRRMTNYDEWVYKEEGDSL